MALEDGAPVHKGQQEDGERDGEAQGHNGAQLCQHRSRQTLATVILIHTLEEAVEIANVATLRRAISIAAHGVQWVM